MKILFYDQLRPPALKLLLYRNNPVLLFILGILMIFLYIQMVIKTEMNLFVTIS